MVEARKRLVYVDQDNNSEYESRTNTSSTLTGPKG